MKILFGIILACLATVAAGNNIRIDGKARVTGFCGSMRDTAIVELKLAWDNSWKDDLNWDAAWIFLKYKKRGAGQQWHHAYLSNGGHRVVAGDEDYRFEAGGTATTSPVTGLYLMRDKPGDGNVDVTLQIKWPLKNNAKAPLEVSDFGKNQDSVYVSVYAVEMVYVPYGSYALGDNFSNGTFMRNLKEISRDVINLTSGYTYSIGTAVLNGSPDYVADHSVEASYPNSTLYFYAPSYWQVDFKIPKEIKFFGIAGAENYPNCTPKGKWYLKGSNDQKVWNILYEGLNSTDWICNTVAYPVGKSIKVTNPGLYRYYRVEMSASNRPSDNGIVIQSIAMSEKELNAGCPWFEIDGEKALVLGTELYAGDGQAWNGTLPQSYPKGYRGFYAMKYEVTQEQYVDFLNGLTLEQQKLRVGNNNFAQMKQGDYVFGNLKKPNCRNGVVFVTQQPAGGPATFANNLNPDSLLFAADDGQTLACNYLSPADMLAYCDWSGMRPMSELEYEKACRRPLSESPIKGEYAWNLATGVNRLNSLTDLKNPMTGGETPVDIKSNVNVGNKINGPVRSGAFAGASSSQVEAGATYWGLMEMSGNLWEMCYTANTGGRNFVSDNAVSSHGDGYIANSGTDVPRNIWPADANAFAVRGGSFATPDTLLRISDRTFACGNYFKSANQRDSTVGFRAVRSVLSVTDLDAGDIYCQNNRKTDTVCSGFAYTIRGEASKDARGKVSYYWYKSENNGISWELLENESDINLTIDYYFINKTATSRVLQFKRKVVCAEGEKETSPVIITISEVVKVPVTESYSFQAAIGYRFDLPQPLDNSMQSKWLYPSGKIVNASEAVIENFTSADDGIYKLYNIGANGCESGKVDVKIMGTNDGISLVDYGTYKAWADGSYACSAKEYLNPSLPYVYSGATGSGVFKILPGGKGTDPISAYCDMTTDGGGWTMVVAQFENDPVSNWNEGIQADYDPSLKTSRSFTLNTTQLPLHTQTAWGKHLDPVFIGYSDFIYTTAAVIPLKTILNIKTGINFQVHRDPVYYYGYHDPEYSLGTYEGWNMTLTYDQMGGIFYSWAFSPLHETPKNRGYGMAGYVAGSLDSYAWTVWVR